MDPGWVSGEKASKWGALEAAAESDAAPGLVSEEKALQAKTSADSFFLTEKSCDDVRDFAKVTKERREKRERE